MKKAVFTSIVLVLLIPFNVYSQSKGNDPVILTIDNQNVTKSDFLRIYGKNNSQAKPDRKGIQEYMDMFINYKLKVIEAEHLGFDTAGSFLKEFNSYRDQLAKPYLTDTVAENNLVYETYKKMLEDVKLHQIFVRVTLVASPEDTLKAYKKINEAREKLLKGEPWDSVVYKYSDDAYAWKKRGGDLGFLTAFQLMPPIENTAYKLKMNEISLPIRSHTGYHIIQLLDRRPSRGEVKVAHIMVAFPENASQLAIDSAETKINDIYKHILAGENFSDLAKKYSDDKRSAAGGGELNWFGTGQMIPEFENSAFALKKDGDISKPIRSSFGWHIIKKLGNRPIRSYSELKDFIKQRFQRDDRSKIGQYALIAKVKMEIGFKDDPGKINLLLPLMDSSVFKGKWSSAKAKDLNSSIMFKIKNESFSVKDFADYVAKSQRARPIPFKAFLDDLYKDFVYKKIMEFENGRLEQLYPEFKYLVQEYHDGILLFNLMEDKIWTKAAKDTVGLEKYYQEHKDQYKWGERVKALVVTSPNKLLIDEAYKMAEDYNSGKIKAQDILNKVCKHDSIKSCINITDTLFEKGDNTILDSIGWKPGISSIVLKDGKFGYFIKKSTVVPELKKLQDVKGVCIADYQAYLEKLYLAELHKKYKIVVNEKLLDKI